MFFSDAVPNGVAESQRISQQSPLTWPGSHAGLIVDSAEERLVVFGLLIGILRTTLMETFLDRAAKVVAIAASLLGVCGTIAGVVTWFERPRVQLLVRKDKDYIPPSLRSKPQTASESNDLRDYQDPHFGSVIVEITNFTDKQVVGTLELGGFQKFKGAEVIDPQMPPPPELLKLEDRLKRMELGQGEPCRSSRPNWPDRPDKKLTLPIDDLKSYGGSISLVFYGLPAEKVDVCLNGAPSDTRYLVLKRDSRMLDQYPIWLSGLSLLLAITAILLFIQSRKRI
jgi:hypothetical protein